MTKPTTIKTPAITLGEAPEISHTEPSVCGGPPAVVIKAGKRSNCFIKKIVKEFPESNSERHLYILKQTELDNLRDIEDPFVILKVDIRINKINCLPKIEEIGKEFRARKFNF